MEIDDELKKDRLTAYFFIAFSLLSLLIISYILIFIDDPVLIIKFFIGLFIPFLLLLLFIGFYSWKDVRKRTKEDVMEKL